MHTRPSHLCLIHWTNLILFQKTSGHKRDDHHVTMLRLNLRRKLSHRINFVRCSPAVRPAFPVPRKSHRFPWHFYV